MGAKALSAQALESAIQSATSLDELKALVAKNSTEKVKARQQAEARRQAQQRRQAWLERYSTCLNGCGKPVAFWDEIHLSLRYGGCCSAECESSHQERNDRAKNV